METKKQEAIRLAYGEYFKECKPDENGWSKIRPQYKKYGNWYDAFPLDVKDTLKCFMYRPRSIAGITDNNGWIPLKGIANEITDRCSIWIMTKNGIEYLKENEFLPIGYATHYQKVIKPQPPIF